MKSISPIIASILLIVMTVAIAGIFYAFSLGMFGSLTQSSSQRIQQQSQITSFTINNLYCSNNILYFDIYNNGNIPININNSQIIFTDNNGNIISINGSNIICNNGNIIPIGSNSLCYIINNSCYYSYTDYIKSTNFVYNGISYNYEILNNNKFNLLYAPNGSFTNTTSISLGYIPITIYNTQNIPTPSPFQQDIAICNGNINIGNNFAYINNATLFNDINPNGQNVYFTTIYNSTPNIYSWYEGQENLNGIYCDVWWINLPNGIPANSNVTIYMYIGNSSDNYYSQYYPYVGEAPQLSSIYGQYDNGNYVFNYYWNFNGTSAPPGINVYTSYGSVTFNNGVTIKGGTTATGGENGIATTMNFSAPIIVEYYGTQSTSPSGEAWGWNMDGFSNYLSNSYNSPVHSGTHTLIDFESDPFGNPTPTPNAQPFTTQGGNITGGTLPTPPSNLFPLSVWTQIYTSSTYYTYQNYINSTGYITGASNTASLPFEIMVGNNEASYDPNGMTVYWLRVRAYPPNGVMPSIYIG